MRICFAPSFRAASGFPPIRDTATERSSDIVNNDFDLSSKVAVVTGGNGGIGLGIAKGLAAAGAAIVVAARNQDKTARAVSDIEALGARAVGTTLDFQSEDSVRGMVAAATQAFGRIDILINNAGIVIGKLPRTPRSPNGTLC